MTLQTANTLYANFEKTIKDNEWFEPHIESYIDYLRDTGKLNRGQEHCDWELANKNHEGFVFTGDTYDSYDAPQTLTIPFDFFDDRTPYEEEARKNKERIEAERRINLRAFLERSLRGAIEDVNTIKMDLTNLDNLERDQK